MIRLPSFVENPLSETEIQNLDQDRHRERLFGLTAGKTSPDQPDTLGRKHDVSRSGPHRDGKTFRFNRGFRQAKVALRTRQKREIGRSVAQIGLLNLV